MAFTAPQFPPHAYSVPQNSFPLPTGSFFSFAALSSAQEKIPPEQSLLYSAERSGVISKEPGQGSRIWKPRAPSPPHRIGKTKGGRALPTRALRKDRLRKARDESGHV
jgi:hypothetical protein